MGIYKINPRDTLTSISQKNGTTVDELVKLNGISNPNRIIAGDTLELPDSSSGGATSDASNNNTTTSPIISTPAPTQPTQTNTNWLYTNLGQAANQSRKDAETALNTHGAWNPENYANAEWMKDVLGQIQNRPEFEYDFNADALYQQYKDKYIQQGKMAMQDTMGQAAAMTGGYGNSYAQTVGQQVYNASLQNLNDVIPELYQMALDKHNMETQDLYNQYGLLLEDYARAYGEHSAEYNRLLEALNRADSNFYNGANMHYTEQSNANNVAQQNWQNEMTVWDANNTNAWKDAEFKEAVRQYDEQMEFQKQQYEDSQKTTGFVDVPDNIRTKLDSFESDADVNDYLEQLEAAGVIDHDEALKLMAEYMDQNEKYLDDGKGNVDYSKVSYKAMVNSTKGWTVPEGGEGGGNLFGIDKNAKVKSPTGETMTLADLKNKLISEGMDSSEARKAIKKLQQELGISSNWLFGL